MTTDEVLKKISGIISNSGNSGYSNAGSMQPCYTGSVSGAGMSGYSGYKRGFSEQEVIDAFLAGYKLLMLLDEEIKPEIIEAAKEYVKKLS